MKYFKILLLLISFSSVSNASYYLPTRDICIEDFYAKGARFYYLHSKTNQWYYTNDHDHVHKLIPSFTYDAVTDKCTPPSFLMLGMDIKDFNFLLGLIGVIIGGIFMFFTTQLFMGVGGKR
ncbi:hypothetical protein [Sulfurimonas sp.]